MKTFFHFFRNWFFLPFFIFLASGVASLIPLFFGMAVFPYSWSGAVYLLSAVIAFGTVGFSITVLKKKQWHGVITFFIAVLFLTTSTVVYWVEEVKLSQLPQIIDVDVTQIKTHSDESLIRPLPYKLDLTKIKWSDEYHSLTGLNPNTYCRFYYVAPLCSKTQGCADHLWGIGSVRSHSCTDHPNFDDEGKSFWLKKIVVPSDPIKALLPQNTVVENLVLLEASHEPFSSISAIATDWWSQILPVIGFLYIFTFLEIGIAVCFRRK